MSEKSYLNCPVIRLASGRVQSTTSIILEYLHKPIELSSEPALVSKLDNRYFSCESGTHPHTTQFQCFYQKFVPVRASDFLSHNNLEAGILVLLTGL